jgi:hypothetical protein
MQAPSKDIQQLLVTASLGTSGTDLFIGFEPDGDNVGDLVITITDTDPTTPHFTEFSYEWPTVQIRVRGNKTKYTEAYDKIQAIANELNGKSNVTVNGARYAGIWLMSGPMYIGSDSQQRPIWVANFRMQRTDTNA